MKTGMDKGSKNTNEDIATVMMAEITYMALPYLLDNPIFENNVIVYMIMHSNTAIVAIQCLIL